MCQRLTYSEQTKWSLAVLLICLIGISACSSSSDKPLVDDGSDTNPSMPGDLTSSVYSSHTAELFWTASIDDGWVMGYDIFRDDVLIKERLDATSFFEANLEPATTYRYSVIAVDDKGRRSIPNDIELTTLDGLPLPLLPVVNRANHVELLRHIFDIYTGVAYRDQVMALPEWSKPAYSGIPSSSSTLGEASITCSNGGTALFVPFFEGYEYTQASWDFTFNDCQDKAVKLDGQLHREYRGGNVSQYFVISSGLSIDDQSRKVYYSGEVELFNQGRGAPYQQWYARDIEFSVTQSVSTFLLTSANTSYNRVDPGRYIDINGEFVIRSATTNGRSVRASFKEGLRLGLYLDDCDNEICSIKSGILELSADDGSKVVLQPANGDEHSVTIEIIDSYGASESLNQPLALWAESFSLKFDHPWPSSP